MPDADELEEEEVGPAEVESSEVVVAGVLPVNVRGKNVLEDSPRYVVNAAWMPVMFTLLQKTSIMSPGKEIVLQ